MIAADTPDTTSTRGAFGQGMYDRRIHIGHTQQQAADLANISVSRWRQLEEGWQYNRDAETRQMIRVRATPSRLFVRRIAFVLEWPLHEAYAAAGYEPDDNPPPAAEIKARDRQQIAAELFSTLIPAQQDGMINVMRLMKPPPRWIPEELREAS